ncbi:hypothetical protein AV530_006383 [Patagioenas fasciata monilis]|uniref:Uncharacterized protein n=1 Tax=Patagioenas fasciata monilis TaxID=372326 RepID=A0A1V4KGJ0_PATFA|nr:hypothetical protein AV530_006383 [Patagioenas fasciata monilis]
MYNTRPVKITLSVAAVNAAGGCAPPEFCYERGYARKKLNSKDTYRGEKKNIIPRSPPPPHGRLLGAVQ